METIKTWKIFTWLTPFYFATSHFFDLCQNFEPRHPRHFFDPRQNFTDPRHPRHPRQSLTHATHTTHATHAI